MVRRRKRLMRSGVRVVRRTTIADDLLIEIGCEELPATYLPAARQRLQTLTGDYLAAQRLVHAGVTVWAAPRRLAIVVRRLAAKQEPLVETLTGPSKAAAFDAAGKPTAAAAGFAAKHGVPVSALRVTTTPRGEYVAVTKTTPGRPAAALVQPLLDQLIRQIGFPKTMRWDASGVAFARPIRWLLALYGARLVPCAIGRVRSAAYTLGHRQRENPRLSVQRAGVYLETLRKQEILVDQEERHRLLRRLLDAAAQKAGGCIDHDDPHTQALLEELLYLAESPQAISGTFAPRFAERLPQEVLLAAMAKGQRLIGLKPARGDRLLPTFLAVLDGDYAPKAVKPIRENIEHVLNAKLADALFFLEKDRRVGLDVYCEHLSGIVFLKGLGSVLDKTRRIQWLASWIAVQLGSVRGAEVDRWSHGQEHEYLDAAASLCKADLASSMVKEFPSLQGVMGGWYAKAAGKSEEVAAAIREHYQPRYQGDTLPSTRIGAIVAIADKMDSIVGCWWKGFAPTGSADPYGIRRAAQGVIAILWEHQLALSLQQLVEQSSVQINNWVESQNRQMHPSEKKGGGAKVEAMPESIGQAVCSYLADRVKVFFADRYRQELVDAVVSADHSLMAVQIGQRLEQLSSVWHGEAFAQAVKVAERTANISKAFRDTCEAKDVGRVDELRFEHPTERELWEVVQRERQPILDLVSQERYADAVKRYGEAFAEPVHRFFYDVMVNVENEPVRRNRLAMMDTIFRLLATQVADLSMLAQSVSGKEKVSHG